jgi:hypothetical protein
MSLPWYKLVDGEFPPENSGHAISGELIEVDHLDRRFVLRVDRDDSQQAGQHDLPFEAAMLPFGSIEYHGAPAALRDIPIGTHLHGLFYEKAEGETPKLLVGPNRRVATEAKFTRCFRLVDDFSYYKSHQQMWKIDAVDLSTRKLTATLQQDGQAVGSPKQFDIRRSARVFAGQGFGTLEQIQPGQVVLFNITWATIYGPGRITDLWLDEPSRELASAQQLLRHKDHIRERGLPGWIDAVDDDAQIVTITFFDSSHPSLFEELRGINPEPHGWPFSGREDDPNAPKGGICVATESLMTYDPVNDRKGGNILHFGKVPVVPGSSGVQIKVQCRMLLEGFRPKRIVRFYPATWPVDALPREEQYYGNE